MEKMSVPHEESRLFGYIVKGGTIRPSKAKTIAVGCFLTPTDRKGVQRFLGLTSYFRRFIDGYAVVAKPLSDLLRQGVKLLLGEEQEMAFPQLKAAFGIASVQAESIDRSTHGCVYAWVEWSPATKG